MSESKPISIRIPQELLEQVDAIALKHYPPRKRGTAPNRSQMILDFITQGVAREFNTVYGNSENPDPTTVSATPRDAAYDSAADSKKTAYDSADERQFITVYDKAVIEEVVQQQLSSLGIAELHQEVAELKKS